MRRLEKPSRNRHPVFPGQYIMQGSILSVHIIDARELRAQNGTGVANSRVRLDIEGNPYRTGEVYSSNNPVWNEVIALDISKGTDTLKIEV